MKLFLIRHAITGWNVQEKAQGQVDIPLSEEGFAQAEKLADFLSSIPISQMISSDLLRCSQTAQKLADSTQVKLELSPLLRERNFGDWEGLSYAEIRARSAETGLPRESVRPPNGESVEDVWLRLQGFFNEWNHNGTSIIFSHGGTSALALSMLLRGTVQTARGFRFPNCSLTELECVEPNTYILRRYASTEHLEESPQRAYGVLG